MNIAITGPARYRLQDLVCIEIALRLDAKVGARLSVEPTGGEDAVLSRHDGTVDRSMEIQVKGITERIGLDHLAMILGHFVAGSVTETLLERLLADETRSGLFVFSGRCLDAIQALVVPAGTDVSGLLPRKASIEGAGLIEALNRTAEGLLAQKRLGERRRDHLRDLAGRLTGDDLSSLVRRVFIHEGQEERTVEDRIHAHLRTLRIPPDRSRDVVERLRAVVIDAKANGSDILASLRFVIDSFDPNQHLPEGYVERGVEVALLDSLARDRALLLAGPPRIGKTWTARRLVAGLQEQGFEARVGGDVEAAARFLGDPIHSPRVFLLDDPLGDAASSGAARNYDQLRRLLERLPGDRRLIVSQGQEPLLALARQSEVEACRIGGLRWFRLDGLSIQVAVRIWEQAARLAGVTEPRMDDVTKLIARRSELRVPGALAFLSEVIADLPLDADPDRIVNRAHSDGIGVVAAIIEGTVSSGAMLEGLAIATAPFIPVSPTELAFIVHEGLERPSRSEAIARIFHFGSPAPAPAPIAYADRPKLDQSEEHALHVLAARRFLTRAREGIDFSHAHFRIGAQQLLRPEVPGTIDGTLAKIERALFSASPTTSSATARNLSWMADMLASDTETLARVFDLAQDGLRSLFPATRDLCFDFLMSRVADLGEERHELIPIWVRQVDVDLDEIKIVGGLVRIVEERDMGGIDDEPDIEQSDEAAVASLAEALEGQDSTSLSFAEAKSLLRYFDGRAGAMTARACARLFGADEAVIRAGAAHLWLHVPRHGDEAILDRLRDERHPSITVAVLKAVAAVWRDVAPERRELLVDVLLSQARSPGAAAALFQQCVLFDRVEHFGTKPGMVIVRAHTAWRDRQSSALSHVHRRTHAECCTGSVGRPRRPARTHADLYRLD